MARVYRPIPVPAGIEVKPGPGNVSVKGKLGTVSVRLPQDTQVKVDKGFVTVEVGPAVHRAMLGTTRAHILNAFTGVSQGYVKALEVRGMGYRVQKTKEGVQIACGYSHPVNVAAPAGITFDVNQVPNPDDTKEQMFQITVKGIDRQAVGEIAAELRDVKPPDTYRGKGVRYKAEYVRKKAGKRAVGTQA